MSIALTDSTMSQLEEWQETSRENSQEKHTIRDKSAQRLKKKPMDEWEGYQEHEKSICKECFESICNGEMSRELKCLIMALCIH